MREKKLVEVVYNVLSSVLAECHILSWWTPGVSLSEPRHRTKRIKVRRQR